MYNFFLGMIVLMSGCSVSRYFSSDLKKSIKSVVKIEVKYHIQDKLTLSMIQKRYSATGFSILTTDTVSLILTNQHVCSMGADAEYLLILQSGENVKAKFIRVDEFADVCLLNTKSFIPALKLANENALQADRIITIGGPEGMYPIIVDGIMSGYYNMNMKKDEDEDGSFEIHFRSQVMSAAVYPGSSGSPVFNMSGKVIGIVFAVFRDKEHISYIVPISEVLRFLDTSDYVSH